jgi:hypothetical protein
VAKTRVLPRTSRVCCGDSSNSDIPRRSIDECFRHNKMMLDYLNFPPPLYRRMCQRDSRAQRLDGWGVEAGDSS